MRFKYYLNIVYYRLELVLASDKGKKVLMNINSVPDKIGLDITKFKYFMETSPYGWLDPNQEGSGYNDMNTVAKVIDLSTASDIAKYVELAEKINDFFEDLESRYVVDIKSITQTVCGENLDGETLITISILYTTD